jgi:hypothetical protein
VPDLIIQFRGICAHFLRSGVPDLPVPHRVVLPSSIDPPPIATGRLMPHLPFLYFRKTDEHAETPFFQGYPLLNGVRLSAGAAGEPEHENWQLLPKLLFYRPDYVPDPFVVLKGHADGYFDISSGRFEVLVEELGEVYTKLTIPDTDVIRAIVPDKKEPVEIRVPEGHYAVIRHLSLPTGTHSRHDFRLHYLTARGSIPRFFEKPLPGELGYVSPNTPSQSPYGGFEALTPACSNSGYP